MILDHFTGKNKTHFVNIMSVEKGSWLNKGIYAKDISTMYHCFQ